MPKRRAQASFRRTRSPRLASLASPSAPPRELKRAGLQRAVTLQSIEVRRASVHLSMHEVSETANLQTRASEVFFRSGFVLRRAVTVSVTPTSAIGHLRRSAVRAQYPAQQTVAVRVR